MEKVEFTVKGYELEQRIGETLEKGETLDADEELCYLLLPSEYADKNIVCILTEE